jgi:hypothetical protein
MRADAIGGVRVGIGGVLVALLVGAAGPTSEANATFRQIVNVETAWCLVSDQAGDVLLNPCQAGNAGQLWERWNGGWTRNAATGLCLRGAGTFSAGSIHASACVWGDPLENWLHWHGGWYQRAAFGANPAECLSRLTGSEPDVTGVACQNPTGPNPPAQLWYTVEASSLPPPPPPPPPPVDPCEPTAAGSGLKLRVRFRGSRRVATAAYGRRLRVRGRLRGADGNPVAGATFCVGVQRSTRAPVRAVGSAVADADGRFVYMLGPGRSRRMWFVHRAGGAAVADSVLVRVRAPVALRASRRSLRNGQSVNLRGRLRGGVRARGLLVELQAQVDGRWRTFATSRTRRNGRFHYRYRFTRTVGVHTYRFRARVRAQRGSPFAAGASRTVRVRVVG